MSNREPDKVFHIVNDLKDCCLATVKMFKNDKGFIYFNMTAHFGKHEINDLMAGLDDLMAGLTISNEEYPEENV